MTAARGWTRREVGAGLASLMGLAAGGCVSPYPGAAQLPELERRLINHATRQDLAAAGVLVHRGGERIYASSAGVASGLSPEEIATGVPARPFTVDTPFRVASQSKPFVARVASMLADAGQVRLDGDVGPFLGFDLRHPKAPGEAITLAMLLSHTSGIRDPEAYWVAAPGAMDDVVDRSIFLDLEGRPLGTWFEYANLNYGLAATVLEAASGERFDRLAQRLVLAPAGVDAGFNWAGMSPARRAAGATLYRRDGPAAWAVQVDGADALAGNAPTVLADPGYDLADYVPGQNGTLFSPQGGLRASLSDLATLAPVFAADPAMARLIWQRNEAGSNGNHDDRYFHGMGMGILHYTAGESLVPGHAAWGHPGEAYGVFGGVWMLPETDTVIAYAALGIASGPPERARHPALNVHTAPLVEIAVEAAGLA